MLLIGDVHGMLDAYLDIVEEEQFSLQLGDFGGDRQWNALNYLGLCSKSHKIVGGNHDPYPHCLQSPYSLGNYGLTNVGGHTLFFIRGGNSIDKFKRVANDQTWSYREELNFSEMFAVVEMYKRLRPDIVVSHVPPTPIHNMVFGDNHHLTKYHLDEEFVENTARLGKICFQFHQPKLWAFGHLHISIDTVIGDTRFIGLNELETFRLE